MNDTLVKEIFSTVIGGPPPRTRFDVAIRLGKRRRRARIAGATATSLVVAGMVAVIVPALGMQGRSTDRRTRPGDRPAHRVRRVSRTAVRRRSTPSRTRTTPRPLISSR